MTSTAPALPPFQRFLDDHRLDVYRFLVASVGRQDADDCFQETFLAALRAYPKLRDASNLRGWVLRIATRKAIDAGRATGRRGLPVGDAAALDRIAGGASASSEPEPLDDGLWRTVRSLPARQRVAVVHRVVFDLSYADVAEAMGSSEETARANVYQGLKRLRKEWAGGDD
jgi:RNA polymerase sigma factor (sigma-70 family)